MRREMLRALPRHAVRALRGDREPLSDDLWELLRSPSDPASEGWSVDRRDTYPFRDPDLFGADEDLGRFAPLRDGAWDSAFGETTRETFVDPKMGWLITAPFNLVDPAMLRPTKRLTRPSLRRYMRDRRRGPVESTLLSLRDPVEGNYYHLLHDLLGGRLRMAVEGGYGVDVPVVVGRTVAELPLFDAVLRRSERLDGRRIIVQDDEYIRCDRAVIARAPRLCRWNAEFLRDLLRIPDSDPDARRRIFLVRGASAGRNFSNASDVEDVAKRFGFELVDTGALTLDEQIDAFSHARYVVAVHGAGLLNLVWRRNAPLSLLEIFPSTLTRLFPSYFFLSRVLGFRHYLYDDTVPAAGGAGVGAVLKRKFEPFRIDAERLAGQVEVMLAEGGD